MTDEVDDDEFLYGRKKGGGASSYGGGTDFRDPHWGADPGQASGLSGLQQQKQNSMNAQMDMTRNALASIYDSEAMGVATAEVHHSSQESVILTQCQTVHTLTESQ